ncbi:MAG: hypothetical protein IT208_13870 [Chthonomonadales bacterium]|nr:hypothetical protein [Chthonomonadales bacterium]
MRIYGSSPLHKYAELIFRCKRMFIVAVILGTLATSLGVYMRQDKYSAFVVIALTGDTATGEAMSSTDGGRDSNPIYAAAQRKAARLIQYWLPVDRDFTADSMKNLGLEAKYGDKFDAKVRAVRDELASSAALVTPQHLKLQLTWDDPKEAEAILNEVYGAFSRKTVAEETAVQTNKRQVLEEQFKLYNKRANEQATRRVKYLKDHYWENPALLGQSLGSLETTQQSIAQAETTLADARSRQQRIDQELTRVPEWVTGAETTRTITEDPSLQLTTQRTDLQRQLQQAKQRYNDLHPVVQDLQKQIIAIDKQIADVRKQPRVATNEQSEVQRTRNPVWITLKQYQAQLGMMIQGYDRRIGELRAQLARLEGRVRAMPGEEVAFQKVEKDYELANNLRNQVRARLAAAQYDEEQSKLTQARLVKLEYGPISEKVVAGGKRVLLLALGPLLGILIAFSFSLLAESLDHTLRTPVEVERFLGKPVLAVIPRMRTPREGRKQLAGATKRSISS